MWIYCTGEQTEASFYRVVAGSTGPQCCCVRHPRRCRSIRRSDGSPGTIASHPRVSPQRRHGNIAVYLRCRAAGAHRGIPADSQSAWLLASLEDLVARAHAEAGPVRGTRSSTLARTWRLRLHTRETTLHTACHISPKRRRSRSASKSRTDTLAGDQLRPDGVDHWPKQIHLQHTRDLVASKTGVDTRCMHR